MKIKVDDKPFSVNIMPDRCGYTISVDKRRIKVDRSPSYYKVNKRIYRVDISNTSEGTYNISVNEENYTVDIIDVSRHFHKDLIAPMQGTILSIDVKKNQKVQEGQTLIRLLSMKMENEIKAEKDCVVKAIKVRKRQKVTKGDVLIELKENKK